MRYVKCSSCTEHKTHIEGQIKWRDLFSESATADNILNIKTSSSTATIVCPGPSIKKLPPEVIHFISSNTDAWGINDVSSLLHQVKGSQDIKFKFIHLEPTGPVIDRGVSWATPFTYANDKKFQFNSKAHGNATLICEQQCQHAPLTMAVENRSSIHFFEYFTYVRQCFDSDCAEVPPLRTPDSDYVKPPWHYHPKNARRPPVPMGCSLNRVLDLAVRAGYKTIMFAGCDGTNAYVQKGQVNDAAAPHPTSNAGYVAWGMGLSEWVAGFLSYNNISYYSLTPFPFGHDGKKGKFPAGSDSDVPTYSLMDMRVRSVQELLQEPDGVFRRYGPQRLNRVRVINETGPLQ